MIIKYIIIKVFDLKFKIINILRLREMSTKDYTDGKANLMEIIKQKEREKVYTPPITLISFISIEPLNTIL
jgi:hypothetical protein